ncbi:MAG TPA: carbamate kinase [Clostridiaceae bacterium]|jgi:carbamate kinase|nr:carbamate kinase [Clostridiaceae bacterium]HBF76394.1 carbamate kinase [Clostridiaceae bacterium]HBG38457.1 carbamate kinase [Clostridiaceae bacterium]HBN28847.1 carbamate kinase [Clostridiaceae bacterium]HBX47645.1 carbamate kinase [Clostridiaceae bacterium]
MARIVVALGGNALQANPKDTSAEAQLKTCHETSKAIADLIEDGNEVIITHGNGPQVGQIIATYEAANSVDSSKPVMPFPECGAMSQGYIGYHLQQSIRQELVRRGIKKQVAAVITQVVVDKDDPGFKNPSKPVGSFFTKDQAEILMKEKGYVMKEDAGRGWRRVVASPMPVSVVEEGIIKSLVDGGHVVITVGGGGVPVIEKEDGSLEGVPAVIDKDLASEKIAELLNADMLLMLTAVEKISLNYNKPNQRDLSVMTVKEAEEYMLEGHFAPGSMLPKVKAAVMFASSKQGRESIVTSLEKAREALKGQTGTKIIL